MKLMKTLVLMLSLVVVMPGAKGADEQNAVALGEKGMQAYNRGDLVTAMGLLEPAAKLGHAPSQATLAYILDKSGFDEQAFQWYSQSAEQGHAEGQYGLAGLYAVGEGVEKDIPKARHWLLKAVAQDHALAIKMYARAFESGLLAEPRDLERALTLYQKCHELGEDSCTYRLSQAYSRGELGLSPDKNMAEELYKQMTDKKSDTK